MTWIRFPFREAGSSLDLGKHGSPPALLPFASRPSLVGLLLQQEGRVSRQYAVVLVPCLLKNRMTHHFVKAFPIL